MKKFEYRTRTKEEVTKRKEKLTYGDKEGFAPNGLAWFKSSTKNKIRLLPPTWKNADHYGFDIAVHYSIGPSKNAYLCPRDMRGEKCPICEEADRLMAEGLTKEAKALIPTDVGILNP